MDKARTQHPNAALTPKMRRRMAVCVTERRWSVAAAAEWFQVDPKTVRKWRDRYLAEGEAGLFDRPSRPRTCPGRTPDAKRAEVIELSGISSGGRPLALTQKPGTRSPFRVAGITSWSGPRPLWVASMPSSQTCDAGQRSPGFGVTRFS